MKFAIIFYCFLIQLIRADPKFETEEGKLNMGWPNFFSPKQAILGQIDHKDEEKFENPSTPLSDSSFNDASAEDEEFDEENLIDYTINGGLRGIYYVMNNATADSFVNLTSEAQIAIEHVLTIDEELFEEVDRKLNTGETTPEGVQLRTPLFLKTVTKTLGKFGSRLTYRDGNGTSNVIHFGNWCGRGGRSAPVDEIDNCCLEQDKCYGRHIKQCPDVWNKPYQYMYAWISLEEEPVCVRSEYSCVNHVCDCDREASLCVKYYADNPWENSMNQRMQFEKSEETMEQDYPEEGRDDDDEVE